MAGILLVVAITTAAMACAYWAGYAQGQHEADKEKHP